MPAYLIADLDIEDVRALDEYRRRAVPILAKYGGRAIIRLGAVTVLEGDWRPKRMVGIEFPEMAALQRWYASDDYQPLIPLRQRVARANVIAVEGL